MWLRKVLPSLLVISLILAVVIVTVQQTSYNQGYKDGFRAGQEVEESGVWLTIPLQRGEGNLLFAEADLSIQARTEGHLYTYLDCGEWRVWDWQGYNATNNRSSWSVPDVIAAAIDESGYFPTVDFWWPLSAGEWPEGAQRGSSRLCPWPYLP